MRLLIVTVLALVGSLHALSVPVGRDCARELPRAGLTRDYYENIGHAVHSMTVQGLRIFNPRATVKNSIPTVNQNTSAPVNVLPYAPEDPVDNDFLTNTMNIIDKIFKNLGNSNDGLGKMWSPAERVAHKFHMMDLWEKIRLEYDTFTMWNPPTDATCQCLLDVKDNGIQAAVQWVANHYKSGTPITLLGRDIPKLTDGATWKVWSARLRHYYNTPALRDAAQYMHCATKDF